MQLCLHKVVYDQSLTNSLTNISRKHGDQDIFGHKKG